MFRMPPSFRGVSSVAFGAVFTGAASKGIPAVCPQVTYLSPDCGEVSQGGRFKLATAKGAGCQALDRTRTGDASITHIPGPLYLLSYKGIGGPEAEADLRAEGKRSGSAEIRPHTPIFAQIQRLKHNILWNL